MLATMKSSYEKLVVLMIIAILVAVTCTRFGEGQIVLQVERTNEWRRCLPVVSFGLPPLDANNRCSRVLAGT